MTRIIVAGSRNFTDKKRLYKVLDEYLPSFNDEIEIVSGHCRGADLIGEEYAKEHRIPLVIFPADWGTYGKMAGYIRNKKMAEYASKENGALVAFPVGDSKGTKMMIRLAHEYGLEINVNWENSL